MSRVVSNISYGTVSVGTSAALILAARATRRQVVIANQHATQTLHIGDDSSVTTSTGLRIAAGANLTLDDYNGPVYGIASGAATTTNYLETYGLL
jgi:hypothetical protein